MSLFRNERYSAKAFKISREVDYLLKPLFLRYVKQGYSIKELSHILMTAVFDIELEAILDWTEFEAIEYDTFYEQEQNELKSKLLFRALIGLSVGLVLGLLNTFI